MFLSHVLLEQRFHLEGNFLPQGNFGLWKEIWKEIAFGRKYCYKEGNEKEILFYLIISKNKAIFIQFCAKEQPRSQGFSLFVIGKAGKGPGTGRSHDFQHPDIVGVNKL